MRIQAIRDRLFTPVDAASLVIFRLWVGLIMLWEVYRYFDHGWIARYYINPTFYFNYFGFEWIKPLPGQGMYVLFVILGLLAICIMIGFLYRYAAALFFIGFTYVFLLDEANYLNHFYLISLISFLMIWIPANNSLSADALLRPSKYPDTVPLWSVWAMRLQVGIAYFFGGVAKINGDWLQLEPMRTWLGRRTDFPIIGQLFTEEWMVASFSYGGMLFDLLIVPALLWKRTRLLAFVFALSFHFLNMNLFTIGIFPWFMMGATTIFFDPDWPRRLLKRWLKQEVVPTDGKSVWAGSPVQKFIGYGLCIYFAWQFLMPLRHHLYPGNVSWTEEGHKWAWHMKLRGKSAKLKVYAHDDKGQTFEVPLKRYLSSRQRRKMPTRPDMIVLFCRYVREELESKDYPVAKVTVDAKASLNGRPYQVMIDPDVDLSRERRMLTHQEWIVPLTTPLKGR